jgi:hypothetical protein
MMRASHINELHFGQSGRSISGGFEAMILDKGIVTLLIPTLTHTGFPTAILYTCLDTDM